MGRRRAAAASGRSGIPPPALRCRARAGPGCGAAAIFVAWRLLGCPFRTGHARRCACSRTKTAGAVFPTDETTMRTSTLLVLAGLALALGGYVVAVDRHVPGTDQRRRERLRVLPELEPSQVGLGGHPGGEGGGPVLVTPGAPLFGLFGGKWSIGRHFLHLPAVLQFYNVFHSSGPVRRGVAMHGSRPQSMLSGRALTRTRRFFVARSDVGCSARCLPLPSGPTDTGWTVTCTCRTMVNSATGARA